MSDFFTVIGGIIGVCYSVVALAIMVAGFVIGLAWPLVLLVWSLSQ